MKLKSLLLFCLLLATYLGNAQGQSQRSGMTYPGARQPKEPNTLTIFSENGDLFYVVINRVKQNINPQSNIRIEGLMQPVNDVQILFADNTTRAIIRKVTFQNPIDNKSINVTLKMNRGNDGDVKLRFFMSMPMKDYVPTPDEYAMTFGQDVQQPPVQPQDGRRDDGGNWNGNRHDGDRHEGDRDHGHNKNTQVVVVTPPPPPPGPMPMDVQTFAAAKQSISSNSWDDGKMSTAKTIAATNYFTTDQVIEICNLFQWDDGKLEFAKYAFKRTVDNNNYFKVNNVFTWDDQKKALNDYVSQNR